MSKKSKPEHHQEPAKSGSTSKAAAIIVILCFLGIMPVLLWLSIPEESPYTSVTTTSPMVQVAAASAGLEVCSSQGLSVKIPGATSAVLYTLAPACNPPTPNAIVQVLVVGFSSTQAQSAAIYNAQMMYKSTSGITTEAFVSGLNVFLVQGSSGNPAVQQVGDSLTAQGATPLSL
jgi:hypothetical protein